MMRPLSRIYLALFLIVSLVVVGSIGYKLIEDLSVLDSIYMSVIVLSTVGLGEISSFGPAGRLFTILLILGGIGTAGYAVKTLVDFFLEGEYRELLRRRAMERTIEALDGHYIVAGGGRAGTSVAENLVRYRAPYVIIEKSAEVAESLLEGGFVCLQGDASDEDVLSRAGISKAAGIVAALANDHDNLFLVLTARDMRPDMRIIARAQDDTAARKIRKAGADHAVTPDAIGGARMAAMMVKPEVVAFLDVMTRGTDLDLFLNAAEVPGDSPIAGLTLAEAAIPRETGLIVIAVKRKEESAYRFNPNSNTRIDAGDLLIALGTEEEQHRLSDYLGRR